jgi:hypothetical protein
MTLIATTLSIRAQRCYAEYHYVEFCYAECHYAQCRGAPRGNCIKMFVFGSCNAKATFYFKLPPLNIGRSKI